MLNLHSHNVMHRHGGSWVPMEPAEHMTPDDHDPERRMLGGERIYRCASCEEEVLIGESEAD